MVLEILPTIFLQIIYRLCALTAAHPAVSNHSNSNYSVSQKKTSPTFLAVTRESTVGFS